MNILDRIAKLIDVKSISTLTLVGTFVFLSVTHEISGEKFLTIFTTVIAFYFGTQNGKSKQTNVEKSVESVDNSDTKNPKNPT
jgi:hypothetical protein